MAHRKAGGSAKNLRDSNPKYLGIKMPGGSKVRPGMIIVRQRGTSVLKGQNVGLGRDHTIFALKEGIVVFEDKRKKNFNGKTVKRKVVHVK